MNLKVVELKIINNQQDCINESINRHHRCPFCSTDLNENDVIKDYHFDNLKSMMIYFIVLY